MLYFFKGLMGKVKMQLRKELNMSDAEPVEPINVRVDQPYFPPGYGDSRQPGFLLPWRHARERFEKAVVYWIGTVSAESTPSVSPVWGVWLDDGLFFDGSPKTRRMRNIAQNPAVSLHLESKDGQDVLILEGRAFEVKSPSRALGEKVAAAYSLKYKPMGYEPQPDQWDQGGLYLLKPHKVLAWTDLNKDTTRWTFEE